jgi:translocation and assembly module TamB
VRRPLLTLSTLVFLGLLAISAWLLGTQAGNQRLLNWTMGDTLQIKSYQGSLLEGVTLGELSYRDEDRQLTIQSLQFQWRPHALFHGLLHIEQLQASGIHYTAMNPSTESKTTAPPSLPVAIQLDQLELADIHITSATETEQIDLIALRVATIEETLKLSKLKFNYAGFTASGDGQLKLIENYPFQVSIQWQGELPELGKAKGAGTIKGDLNSVTIDHSTDTPFTFSTRGQITLAGNEPILQLEGDWQQAQWPLQAARLKSVTGNYRLSGSFSHPQLESEAELHFPGTETPPASLKLKTQLSTTGLNDLSATLLEQGDGTTPAMSLNVQGAIKLQDDTVKLDIKGDWLEARWPLLSTPLTVSPKGEFTIKGPLQQLQLNSKSMLEFPQKQAPDMEAHLQGLVSPTDMQALQLDATLLGGNIRATGQLNWDPVLSWDLSFSGASLDPAQQWPEWPGKLALEATIKGGENNQGLWLDADLKNLSGTLQQQPISASGQGRYDQSGLKLQRAKLNSGPNQLSANGSVGDTLNLSYQLDAPNLNAFWTALKGSLSAQGQLTGKLSAPEVNSTLKGHDLTYQEHKVDQIDGHLVWEKGQAIGALTAKGVQSGAWRGRSLTLALNGKPDAHRLELLLDSQSISLSTALKGGWQNDQWQGELATLSITQPQFGRWTTQSPATLQASTKQIKLTETCLTQHSARLCSSGDWTPDTSRFAGNITALPLKQILLWLPQEVAVEGDIDGHFQLAGPLTALKGEAKLQLDQGVLLLEATEEQPVRLALQNGLLSLRLSPQENQAELQLQAGEGQVTLSAKTGPLSSDRPIPLSGQLNAEIPDLKPIGLLVPGLTDIRGKLETEATLEGYLLQPQIQGFLKLSEGSANLPQLGLELREIQLTARNEGTERLLLQGEMTSGSGPLKLNGDLLLQAEQGWPLTLTLKGENVQVVRLPEAEAYATSDLEIGLKKNLLTLKGKLLLPKATIQLRELPKSAVSLSDDEIIIGQDEQTTKVSPLAIDAEVTVQVGNQVRFNGFGLNTRLEGQVDLRSKQGRNLAQGELALKEGRYKAYGQDLTITQGRLLFNGPPENPSLDIKATRLSLDQSVTAILGVNGNLRAPQVQVSSTPVLPEEEALSYLITGQGLSAEGPGKAALLRQAVATKGLEKSQEILDRIATGLGVDEVRIQEGSSLEDTALLLGKYLSPDLYVSYAVGLFDNQGALITRYRLSERLRLEVQSGKGQSMDLIYDVER